MTFSQNIKNQNCDFELSTDRIDVWQIDLTGDHNSYEKYIQYLSDDENFRLNKFKITAKRYEFSRVRSILRYLLKRYLNADPRSIKFGMSSHGKPFVIGHDISFNVTHSHGCALIGFTRNTPIGLDVEKLRNKVDCQGLSRRYFSPNESDELLAIAEEDQQQAFFTCWTRKEAFVKALGRGIGFGLDNFDVAFQNHDQPRIKDIRFKEENAKHWGVASLNTSPGYVASICYKSEKPNPIQEFTWHD